MRCLIILLAGPSGSGKSHLAKLSGLPILRLDNFYKAATDPDLPRLPSNQIDWDDVGTWEIDTALAALRQLSETGRTIIPVYDIKANGPTGTQEIDIGQASAFIAEGIFAQALAEPCRESGLPVITIWLDRSRWGNWWRRFNRDIRQKRKPIGFLWRRGIWLCQAEPALRQAALASEFRPLTMSQARQVVAATHT